MFGDLFHGSILFVFGIYLCLWNDSIQAVKGHPMKVFNKMRYFILMMGFFATYCGLIYNDFTSLGLDLFGSCYDAKTATVDNGRIPDRETNCVYPFGMDPAWMYSENDL